MMVNNKFLVRLSTVKFIKRQYLTFRKGSSKLHFYSKPLFFISFAYLLCFS